MAKGEDITFFVSFFFTFFFSLQISALTTEKGKEKQRSMTDDREWNDRFDIDQWDSMSQKDKYTYMIMGQMKDYVPDIKAYLETKETALDDREMLPRSFTINQANGFVREVKDKVISLRATVRNRVVTHLNGPTITNLPGELFLHSSGAPTETIAGLPEGQRDGIKFIGVYFDDVTNLFDEAFRGFVESSTVEGSDGRYKWIDSEEILRVIEETGESLGELQNQFMDEFASY